MVEMSCTSTVIQTAPAHLGSFKGTLTLLPPLPSIYDPLDSEISTRLLHSDILRQILLHLSPSTLARLLRVSKDIYSIAGPILYSTISYLPDRYGPTPLDGLNTPVPRPPRRLSYVPNEDHHDHLPFYSNNKRALLRYTKELRIGYHHHESSHAHTHTPTHNQNYPSQPSPRISQDMGIDMPNLRVLHISGERSCVKKSCPYLTRAKPRTVVIDKIDLFSGSPRWTHPFVLPCHTSTQKAIYLITSPFFLRNDKMQGLDPVSFGGGVGSSTFIFALREYEVEWRDTARKMSDSDSHSALVGHLVSLLSGCLGDGAQNLERQVLFVGLELVAAHLRPSLELPSNRPEDLVDQFRNIVLEGARRSWATSGIVGELQFEDALSRCRFLSLREYIAEEMKDDELDRAKLESWASCWEHIVASSAVDVTGA